MARAIWSGSISFGLLNVPVKLYSAVSKQTIRFRELRESDGSRVKHKRVAEKDGKEFADEVTNPEDLGSDVFAEKPAKPDDRELEMAKQLIESLSTGFDAEKYRDE